MNEHRPLTWDEISTPSKIMLPSYLGLFMVMGFDLTFLSLSDLFISPGVRYLAEFPASVRGWGVLFLIAGVVMVIAIGLRHRTLMRYALWWGAICLFVWALIFLKASIDDRVAPGTWAPWLVLAAACFASERSLLKGDK